MMTAEGWEEIAASIEAWINRGSRQRSNGEGNPA